MAVKPEMIVFDLDYTLWPFWVDTHFKPPFKKDSSGNIRDSDGAKVNYYPEVPKVLESLHNEGYTLGIASRTSELRGARQLLELFGWNKFFKHQEIYPGCKITHFNKLAKDSQIKLSKMLFFDDELGNINDLRSHGVISILVRDGVTMKLVEDGLKEFTRTRSVQLPWK